MIIYRSFYEAIKDLPEEEGFKAWNAIYAYGLNGEETELTGIAATIFKLIKPQLDANQRKFENGTKGGRPKKQDETKKKPNQNLDETKMKANGNGNGNGNLNNNLNSNLNLPVEPVEPVELLERASDDVKQERIDDFLQGKMLDNSIFEETKQKTLLELTNDPAYHKI